MAILKVARLGNPVMREKSVSVSLEELCSPEIQELIDNMIMTMREYDGVGLAAPQVHVSKQIAVIEVHENKRYPDVPNIPLTVLINPHLKELSKSVAESWEGCLSIPDLRGVVPRSESLVCQAMDRKGGSIQIKADGFFARVIQHEWDHLQGKVYLDRMPNFLSLTHLAEFHRFWSNQEK